MFLTHPQSKPAFRRYLFLTSLILNTIGHYSALLKITLITGLLLIFSKFITSNTNIFKTLLLMQVLKKKFKYTLFLKSSFDTTTNLFGIQNSNQLALFSYHNSPKMNFHPLLITLITSILNFIIFLISFLPIFHTSPRILIVLIKVLTFLLLFVLMQHKIPSLIQSTPHLMSLYKLFHPPQM